MMGSIQLIFAKKLIRIHHQLISTKTAGAAHFRRHAAQSSYRLGPQERWGSGRAT